MRPITYENVIKFPVISRFASLTFTGAKIIGNEPKIPFDKPEKFLEIRFDK